MQFDQLNRLITLMGGAAAALPFAARAQQAGGVLKRPLRCHDAARDVSIVHLSRDVLVPQHVGAHIFDRAKHAAVE